MAVFLRVVLPLSLPGVAAGVGLVFIPAIGEYVIPALLGGPQAQLVGQLLWQEFFSNRDWPTAAAVAVWLLVVLVAVPGVGSLIAVRLQRRVASPMRGQLMGAAPPAPMQPQQQGR